MKGEQRQQKPFSLVSIWYYRVVSCQRRFNCFGPGKLVRCKNSAFFSHRYSIALKFINVSLVKRFSFTDNPESGGNHLLFVPQKRALFGFFLPHHDE